MSIQNLKAAVHKRDHLMSYLFYGIMMANVFYENDVETEIILMIEAFQ